MRYLCLKKYLTQLCDMLYNSIYCEHNTVVFRFFFKIGFYEYNWNWNTALKTHFYSTFDCIVLCIFETEILLQIKIN